MDIGNRSRFKGCWLLFARTLPRHGYVLAIAATPATPADRYNLSGSFNLIGESNNVPHGARTYVQYRRVFAYEFGIISVICDLLMRI